MGSLELATDDRFVDHVARGRNQDELDKIIGDWAAQREPTTSSRPVAPPGDQRTHQHRRRWCARDPRLRARGMLVDHWDERISRNIGPGVVPVLSERPAPCATPDRPGPASTTPRCIGDLLGLAAERVADLETQGGAVTRCPHVTIREVCLRDGLQIEDPIPLSAKLELLAAIVATGVREVEATAFVSPVKVPALADAPGVGRPAETHLMTSNSRPGGQPVAPARDRGGAAVPGVRGVGRRRPQPGQRRPRAPCHRADRRHRRDRPRRRGHRPRSSSPPRGTARSTGPTARAGARRRRRRGRNSAPTGWPSPTPSAPPPRTRHRLGPRSAPVIGDLPLGRISTTPGRRPGQRVRRRAGRCHPAGRLGRRAGRLPVRAGRQRQHRHRGSGLPVAGQRHRRRRRPGPPPSTRPGGAAVVDHELPSACCAPATGSWAEMPPHADRQGRQTREAIEDCGAEAVRRAGFHGTTWPTSPPAAGKVAASFYRYFDDKEDLLAALAESFLHDIVTLSGSWVHLPESPRTPGSSPRWSPPTGTSSSRTSASWSRSPNSVPPSRDSPRCRTSSAASAWTSSPTRCTAPRRRATPTADLPNTSPLAIALLFESSPPCACVGRRGLGRA